MYMGMCVCVYTFIQTHPLFRVTQINTQSHTVSLQASTQTSPTDPDTGGPHPHRPNSSFQPSDFQKTGFLSSRW